MQWLTTPLESYAAAGRQVMLASIGGLIAGLKQQPSVPTSRPVSLRHGHLPVPPSRPLA